MRKLLLIVALLAMTASLVPNAAHATHCRDIFILSGTNAVLGPNGEKLSGVNIGSATCTVASSRVPDVQPNVNYLTPGASHLWVAVAYANHPVSEGAPSGTIKIGSGAASTITGWKKNDLRSRWESTFYAVTSATSYTATLTIAEPSTGLSSTQSVTYTKAA